MKSKIARQDGDKTEKVTYSVLMDQGILDGIQESQIARQDDDGAVKDQPHAQNLAGSNRSDWNKYFDHKYFDHKSVLQYLTISLIQESILKTIR